MYPAPTNNLCACDLGTLHRQVLEGMKTQPSHVCLYAPVTVFGTRGRSSTDDIQVPSRIQSVTELALNVYISLSLIFILHGAKSGFKT